MSLLWIDGFDHYTPGAADVSGMLDGAYAQCTNSQNVNSTRARTGAYSLRCAFANYVTSARRIFGAAKTTIGLGAGFWFDSLPSSADNYPIFTLCDTNNIPQLYLVLQTTGRLTIHRSNGSGGQFSELAATLGGTGDGVIVAGAFQHIEMMAVAGQTDGAVEVRANGVTVISAASVDTVASSLVEFSQMRLCAGIGSNPGLLADGTDYAYVDDLFAWDSNGTRNNDFLGDRRVRLLLPNADTAVADWSLSGAASGYDCINDSAPDGDSTYIAAADLGGGPAAVSEFGLQDPPATIGAVAGVMTVARVKKVDPGVANVQTSMLSGASASDGADRPITSAYTYYHDMMELDPDTGTAWTESSLAAAKIRIARTA